MKRPIPDSLAARMLLVLIVGLTVSHLLSNIMYLSDRSDRVMSSGGEHVAERIATIVRLVGNAPVVERGRIAALADEARLHVVLSEDSLLEGEVDGSWQARALGDALAAHLGPAGAGAQLIADGQPLNEAWARHLESHGEGAAAEAALRVAVPLEDGGWLNFAAPVEITEPLWSFRFALSMAVMLLSVAVFSAIVIGYLTRPLASFARAAQRLGVDVKAPPLPQVGPAEVRRAARAFNEMQARLRRFIEDRTEMIAAISHDLGTPITRLRLRAEFIEDEEQRRKMLADLDDMQRMVSSALSFARDDAAGEPRASVDLKSLVQRACDDVADAGYEVEVATGEAAVPFACRPAALRRALTNLIENAAKYGKRARVCLEPDAMNVRIVIEDEGPGIPEHLRDEAFKPFRRLEASRSRETGGTGLGLTVARTIIRGHGGDLALANRDQGGLRVEVRLPRR